MSYIKLLLEILKDVFWLIVRGKKKADDPTEQARKRESSIDSQIANKDSKAASVDAAADLRNLDRLRNSRRDN